MSKKNLRPTAGNLKKLEQLLENLGYKIIYEKGTFQSGYCLVNERKMIVMNKFYKTDMRVNSLLKILAELQPSPDQFEEVQRDFYQSLSLN
jgi:hypothetical protein